MTGQLGWLDEIEWGIYLDSWDTKTRDGGGTPETDTRGELAKLGVGQLIDELVEVGVHEVLRHREWCGVWNLVWGLGSGDSSG